VKPGEAISEAALILDRHLKLFADFADGARIGFIDFGPEGMMAGPQPPDARIEELDFSVRTYNCLKKANILTIGELVQYSEQDLMNIRNFGKKSLGEVRDKLAMMNLSLRRTKDGGPPPSLLEPAVEDEDYEDDSVAVDVAADAEDVEEAEGEEVDEDTEDE
jgi:DNA-directed RNA polymerase subunit alpha